MNLKSQHDQDKFIIDYFNKKQNGFFIDIGAHDGITLSNTYILEKEFNWNGICIEPMLHQYKKLEKNRNCILYNCAIYDSIGEKTFLFIDYDGYPDMLSGILKDMPYKQVDELLSETSRIGSKIRHLDNSKGLFESIYDEPVFTENQKEKHLENIDRFETWLINKIKE